MDLLLWVLIPLLLFAALLLWLRKARQRGAGAVAAGVSAETAGEASGKLSAQAHTEVYAAIARGNFMGAVQAYRSHTKVSVKQAMIAVQSLEKYPQIYRHPDLE